MEKPNKRENFGFFFMEVMAERILESGLNPDFTKKKDRINKKFGKGTAKFGLSSCTCLVLH